MGAALPASVSASTLYWFSTLAGQVPGISPSDTDAARHVVLADARFNSPTDILSGYRGYELVSDTDNHVLRKIVLGLGRPDLPDYVEIWMGQAGSPGSQDDAPGQPARLNRPTGLAIDGVGHLYVADTGNHTIRKQSSQTVFANTYYTTVTVAGAALQPGAVDGTGASARFSSPMGLATDTAGNLYVADSGNHAIRKVTPAGVVTTFAGALGQPGHINGSAASARFRNPRWIAYDRAANLLLVSDTGNHVIRCIYPNGDVGTWAGTAGAAGWVDGSPTQTRFSSPGAVRIATDGSLLIADTGNHAIRRLSRTSPWTVSTVAGGPTKPGNIDGAPDVAALHAPSSLTVSPHGTLVVDQGNRRIRRLSPDGSLSPLAGPGPFVAPGRDGIGEAARFHRPEGLVAGADGTLYVADTGNHTLRKINLSGEVSTLAGIAGETGFVDEPGPAARFSSPRGLALAEGGLFVADTGNHAIRRLDLTTGKLTSFTSSTRPPVEGGSETISLSSPRAIAAGPDGFLYVADTGNHAIRRLSPSGQLEPYAGLAGVEGGADDARTDARFRSPDALAFSPAGNLYVLDRSPGYGVRRIAPDGSVSTLRFPSSLKAPRSPISLAFDSHGNLYLGSATHELFLIARADDSLDAEALPIAGKPNVAGDTDSGEGPLLYPYHETIRLNHPSALAFAPSGLLHVADTRNSLVRRAAPRLPTLDIPSLEFAYGSVNFTVAAGPLVQRLSVSGLPEGHSVSSGSGYSTVYGGTVAAGTYALTFSAENPLGRSEVVRELVVTPASRELTFPSTTLYYDGTPRVLLPHSYPGRGIRVLYDGSPVAPTEVGTYVVTIESLDPNYVFPQSLPLSVVLRPQELPLFANWSWVGEGPLALPASSTAGHPLSYELLSGPGQIAGHELSIHGAGVITLRATAPGDSFNAPLSHEFVVRVGLGYAKLTIDALDRPYTGVPREVDVVTSPENLALDVRYWQITPADENGPAPDAVLVPLPGPPTEVGLYRVEARVAAPSSTDYEGQAAAIFRVVKAPLTVRPAQAFRLRGRHNPAFELLYRHPTLGLLPAPALARAPTARTTATASSPPGVYPITVRGGSDPRYTFVYETGELHVLSLARSYETLLIDPAAPESAPLGKLRLTLSAGSLTFSGTLILAEESTAIPIKGVLQASADFATAQGVFDRSAGRRAALALRFDFDAEKTLRGTVSLGDQAAWGQLVPTTPLYVGASGVTSPWTGAYTVDFETPIASADDPVADTTSGTLSAELPRGFGHATARIAKASGGLAVAGRLADGTRFTVAARPTDLGRYTLFARPYGAKRGPSRLAGALELVAHPDAVGFPGRYGVPAGTQSLHWVKHPRSPDASANDRGFGVARLGVTVTPWLPSGADLVRRVGLLPDADNGLAVVEVIYAPSHESDLTSEQIARLPVVIRLSAEGRPIWGVNEPAGFALKVSPAKGTFSGFFLLEDVVPAPTSREPDRLRNLRRKVPFFGVLRQRSFNAADEVIARGFFLVPPPRGADSTTSRSGAIEFVAPPLLD